MQSLILCPRTFRFRILNNNFELNYQNHGKILIVDSKRKIVTEDKKMNLEEIYKLMKERGQRLTRQKVAVLTVFIENSNKLLSVQQIQEMLSKGENIDIATIYRNVQNFAQLGILESLINDRGVTKYLIQCHKEHHHHLICLECGKIIPILCDRKKFSDVVKEHEFEDDYHTLEIYGRCKQCIKHDK